MNRNIERQVHAMIYEFKDDLPQSKGCRVDQQKYQIPKDHFERESEQQVAECQLLYEERPERTPEKIQKSQADHRPPCDAELGPQRSPYENYNREQVPIKDPDEGFGAAAAQATTAQIPQAKRKKPEEFVPYLPQNNATLRHPRIWLPTEAGCRPGQAERDQPRFRVHEIISIERILTVRDLASRVEHLLHITEPCKLYEPPEDIIARCHEPMQLQFLEWHERTDNEKALGYMEGDPRYARRFDNYWTNNPKVL